MISSYLRNKERYTTSKIISDIRQTEEIVVQEEAGFCSRTEAFPDREMDQATFYIFLAISTQF